MAHTPEQPNHTIGPDYVRLMAAYNEWQNRTLYAAAKTTSDAERRQDRGAFFGSIHATLSHVLWGDQIWLSRLGGESAHPMPSAPDVADSQTTHETFAALHSDRQATDRALLRWATTVTGSDFQGDFTWESTSGGELTRPRWVLVVQLFNHGTHHRGQVHAMLTAAGATTQDTDVQYMESPHWPL